MQLTVDKDLEANALTVVATFDHPVTKVWDLYADPRKMERIWGPPAAPATVTEHQLEPGGVVQYFMSGDEGEKYYGRWDVVEVEEHERFTVKDSFADADGNPVPDMPVTEMVFTFEPTDTGSTMRCIATYASAEALAQVLEMGMEEGMKQAMGQMDAVLDEG